MPLRIACGNFLGLARAVAHDALAGSPTTTSAANDMFLPPFTTLVTRLIETTSSFRFSRFASNFFFINAIMPSIFPAARSLSAPARPKLKLELETSLTSCVGQRLYPAVIQIAATIEDHLLDALLLRAFGDQLAHRLGRGDVAAVCLSSVFLPNEDAETSVTPFRSSMSWV